MAADYIGLDVHCQFTEFAVVTSSGRVTKRGRCATTVPALLEAIESVKRPRYVAFEEGPMAEWLYRNLLPSAEGVLACEPRRDRWIAQDGEKDDPLDAAKVAQLHRGGYLKAVHHPQSEQRSIFKGHVSVYHDRVRQRVRTANRIIAQFRSHGVVIQEADFAAAAQRQGLLRRLPADRLLQKDLQLLWEGYDLTALHVAEMERSLRQLARKDEVLRRFQEVPGIGPVWAATFYAYVDTPWGFRSKEALWKYLGIGLERRHSGNGPLRLQVPKTANRRLKWMILSAAEAAIRNLAGAFARQYARGINAGLSHKIARRNVARSLAATLWGMWKSGHKYHPEWVGRGTTVGAGSGMK
jgi:transposase